MPYKCRTTINIDGMEELQALLDRHEEIGREMQSNVEAIRCKLSEINCIINKQADEADI